MKDFKSCFYEIKGLDDKGVVEFIANAFNNKDTDKDVSLFGSFAKTIKDNGPRIRHFKYHNNTMMPGVVRELVEIEEGLKVTSQLILATQLGRETYEEYKALFAAGKQMEHSVGVNAIKYMIDEENDCRKVSEWKLWEVSTLTAWGANDKALALSVKELKDATREEIEKEIIFLKGLLNISSYSDLKLEQIEKQYNFLDKIKAGLQPGDNLTDSTTLDEYKKLLNIS